MVVSRRPAPEIRGWNVVPELHRTMPDVRLHSTSFARIHKVVSWYIVVFFVWTLCLSSDLELRGEKSVELG